MEKLELELDEGRKLEYDFKIIEVKEGSMGIVYICKDKSSNRLIALKTFQDKYFLETYLIDTFISETKIWLDLKPHFNVVQAFGMLQYNGKPYICLEYVQGDPKRGTSLKEVVSKKKLSLNEILLYSAQICFGMIHINDFFRKRKKQVVHRDLKPENILIDSNNIVKITDLGLMEVTSRFVNLYGFKKKSFAGTPAFASPEQLGGDILDERTDIYALGKVLYFMTTGNTIVGSNIDKKVIPNKLQTLIFKCVDLDKKNRFDSFEIVLEAISNIFGTKEKENLNLLQKEIFNEAYKSDNEIRDLAIHAQSAFVQKDYKKAVKLGHALLKKGGVNKSQIYLNLALSYDRLGIKRKYKKFTLLSLECDPESIAALHSLGIIYCGENNIEKEIECYDKVIKLEQNYVPVLLNRAYAYTQLERFKEAEIDISTILKISPDFESALFLKALICTKLNKMDEYSSIMQKLVNINPSFSYLNNIKIIRETGLSGIEWMLGEGYKSISKYLNQSQKDELSRLANDKKEKVRFNAQMLIQKKETNGVNNAIKLLEDLLIKEDTDEETLNLLGRAYLVQGNYHIAESYLKRTLEANPNNSQALTNYAWCLGRNGKISEAKKYIYQALQIAPEKENNWSILADIFIEEGNIGEAIHCYEKMIKINPSSDNQTKLMSLKEAII